MQNVRAASLLLGLLVACGSDSGGSSSSGSAAKSAAPAKAEMVEKDLSKVEAFKGWVAKGPADAEVMQDLGGVRIATKKVMGAGSFDLAFKEGKPNYQEMKEAHKKAAEIAKMTYEYTVDTADALEWTTSTGSTKLHAFSIVVTQDGKDFTCYTVSPRESEAETKELKEACKTLKKK